MALGKARLVKRNRPPEQARTILPTHVLVDMAGWNEYNTRGLYGGGMHTIRHTQKRRPAKGTWHTTKKAHPNIMRP